MSNKKDIQEFKEKLAMLLSEYDVVITSKDFQSLMEYPAITFVQSKKEYQCIDNDGFAESNIDSDNLNELTEI